MNNASRWYWLHCLSPLHIGSGDGVGIIDQPIIREKVTEWPFIPGSTVKGVLRNHFISQEESKQAEGNVAWVDQAFGRGKGTEDELAGAVVFSDGRLLAFPVASRYGIFAYVTSPLVLERFKRDATAMGIDVTMPDMSSFTAEQAWITEDSKLVDKVSNTSLTVYIDEFVGTAEKNTEWHTFATWLGQQCFAGDTESQRLFVERCIVVSDEVFQYLVTMCSEVTPRIRLNEETKTTVDGALWYEEYVPTEALFYGLMWCDRIPVQEKATTKDELLRHLETQTVIQIGGNATVGKGRVNYRAGGER
ncbi:type III-B CRISPR module RAMP protein Cmr4 [Paenibacillus hunanensis]|uniref:type III-B CRISPR module RAMP protein Cmr4 n=1 Tax=Paenibacillus hunanensis TaxID=539262 RepID=UPI0020274D93|nr:type III-B CRISPR module RAMP protein Cmr4 [Paenibacillus hunanensis]MCL9662165.1 type III-B CRISPR module RAMP protein Cmr4 [Paenibacillus hunanensis]